jgi:hypothetical protein
MNAVADHSRDGGTKGLLMLPGFPGVFMKQGCERIAPGDERRRAVRLY